MVTALLALSAGCNGILVVREGPKADQLNWLGRTVAWTGWDVAGLAKEESVE